MTIGESNREELEKLLPPWDVRELQRLCREASFTVQDMATWCEVGKSTMRSWAVDEVAPHYVKQQYLQPRLALLQRALKDLSYELPVPLLKRHERTKYIQKVLADALALPKINTTKRRG